MRVNERIANKMMIEQLYSARLQSVVFDDLGIMFKGWVTLNNHHFSLKMALVHQIIASDIFTQIFDLVMQDEETYAMNLFSWIRVCIFWKTFAYDHIKRAPQASLNKGFKLDLTKPKHISLGQRLCGLKELTILIPIQEKTVFVDYKSILDQFPFILKKVMLQVSVYQRSRESWKPTFPSRPLELLLDSKCLKDVTDLCICYTTAKNNDKKTIRVTQMFTPPKNILFHPFFNLSNLKLKKLHIQSEDVISGLGSGWFPRGLEVLAIDISGGTVEKAVDIDFTGLSNLKSLSMWLWSLHWNALSFDLRSLTRLEALHLRCKGESSFHLAEGLHFKSVSLREDEELRCSGPIWIDKFLKLRTQRNPLKIRLNPTIFGRVGAWGDLEYVSGVKECAILNGFTARHIQDLRLNSVCPETEILTIRIEIYDLRRPGDSLIQCNVGLEDLFCIFPCLKTLQIEFETFSSWENNSHRSLLYSEIFTILEDLCRKVKKNNRIGLFNVVIPDPSDLLPQTFIYTKSVFDEFPYLPYPSLVISP
jgi:hypothetical protein